MWQMRVSSLRLSMEVRTAWSRVSIEGNLPLVLKAMVHLSIHYVNKTYRRKRYLQVVYKVSLTKPKVPNEEAISSSTFWLSFRCTSISSSSLGRISGFAIRTSPCMRKKRFCKACTASKSRCESSRRDSALMKSERLSIVIRDLSSSSRAAGESIFA